MDNRYDSRIFELIPHRPPMMLINKIVDLDESSSSSLVFIDSDASFYEPDKGIPTWVGIEYMGQTSALIAGYRLQKGLIEPHLGFLIGTRAFKTEREYFEAGSTLKVSSRENAVLGSGFAAFDCLIENYDKDTGNTKLLAKATLSVFRRPVNERDAI